MLVSVISFYLVFIISANNVEAVIMVRHFPLPSNLMYKPYYRSPMLTRRVQRQVFFNTPSSSFPPVSSVSSYLMKNPQISAKLKSPILEKISSTPKGMLYRRFMWNDMDETADDLIQGVANGADVMKQMFLDAFKFSQPTYRMKKHYDFYQAEPSNRIRNYARDLTKKVIRLPSIPRKLIKIIATAKQNSAMNYPITTTSVTRYENYDKPETKFENYDKSEANFEHYDKPETKFEHYDKPEEQQSHPQMEQITQPITISKEALKQIEKEEEKKVEEASLYSTNSDDIISGQISEFDSSWTPITPDGSHFEHQIQKPHSVSDLHIDTQEFTPMSNPTTYEVTEEAAESQHISQAFKPMKNYNNPSNKINNNNRPVTRPNISTPDTMVISTTNMITTTEKPNYPEYFVDKFTKEVEEIKPTENPFMKKLQVIAKKRHAKNERKYSNIQSVTTAHPSKIRPIRKYSSKLKSSNFKELYSKQVEHKTERKKPKEIKAEADLQPVESEKSAKLILSEEIPTAFTTRIPPQQVKAETTTIYGNRDVNRYRSRLLSRGGRKFSDANSV